MTILSIETSCDETAISIVRADGTYPDTTFTILGNVLLSQANLHAEFGGVFPALAKREHAKNLVPLLKKVMHEARLDTARAPLTLSANLKGELEELLAREPGLFEALSAFIETVDAPHLDAIAVTYGPGLAPALWVGINFAKALSRMWGIPIIPINHMEGHLLSSILSQDKGTSHAKELSFPVVALLVSGGHTEIVLMKDFLSYQILGETRDDAAGEAYDKVARMLDLPYPGGPLIAKLAEKGGPNDVFRLPRPMIGSGDYDFSFSGLKTAVLYMLRDRPALSESEKADLCYEFQTAVTDVLTKKAVAAAQEYGASMVMLGGGVSANKHLRNGLAQALANTLPGTTLVVPDTSLSTDNALMIAMAAYMRIEKTGIPDASDIQAFGNLKIGKKIIAGK